MTRGSRHPVTTATRALAALLCVYLTAPWAAEEPAPPTPDGIITGAGAHFAWIVFDALKADLAKAAGREIVLYGKNSMLGQGCNAGIKSAKLNGPGNETFGFVCCTLSDEEVAQQGIQVHPLALEPILILVNKANPVRDLGAEQIRAIFRGDIVNWKEVGGEDRPIVVITRLHCKKRPGHWKRILPDASDFRAERLNVSSADDMVQRVADFPGAIGHVGATWEFGADSPVRRITVDGLSAGTDSLKDGSYPFYRKLSAVTDRNPSEAVMRLIREAQSGPAFHRVAARYGLLPLNPPRDVEP